MRKESLAAPTRDEKKGHGVPTRRRGSWAPGAQRREMRKALLRHLHSHALLLLLLPAEITCMHTYALMHTSRAVLRFPPGTFVERALSARER